MLIRNRLYLTVSLSFCFVLVFATLDLSGSSLCQKVYSLNRSQTESKMLPTYWTIWRVLCLAEILQCFCCYILKHTWYQPYCFHWPGSSSALWKYPPWVFPQINNLTLKLIFVCCVHWCQSNLSRFTLGPHHIRNHKSGRHTTLIFHRIIWVI